MKFFLDTADLDEIKEAASWGALAGVTTNPTLYSRIGGKLADFHDHIARICEIVDGPVSAESVAMTRDEIIKDGMEPVITMSHYDIPLHLVTEYGGFANRKMIDFFVRYATTLLERFKGKVKYWIVCNQVNLVPTVQFGSLGIYDDQAENMEELMYQAVHNQFVTGAKVVKLAREIDPDAIMGTMVADGTMYPATCNPEDVVLTMKKNRMQYYFTDVQFRGEYPVYALRYFKENNISIQMEEGDEELLKENPMQFLAMSYYYTKIVDSTKNTIKAFYFLPYMLGSLIVGFIFNYIFANLIPELGKTLGIEALSVNILGTNSAMWGIIAVSLWIGCAFNTLIYIAGLQSIDTDVYEAADLDGATGFKRFSKITFPLLAPSFTINMVLSAKGYLMVYDQIMAMTDGGPGTATTSIAVLIYKKGFGGGQFAYQSANAVVLFIVVVLISVFQLRILEKREEKLG